MSTFRGKAEPVVPEVQPEVVEPTRGEQGEPVEVPYLDYEKQKGHPYSVDRYELGDKWADPEGGFPEELAVIEEYIQSKIQRGEIANSMKAVEKEYKEMEKINNLKDEERLVIKLETLAAYVRFLMETDKIKYNFKRYRRMNGNN